MYSSNLSKFAFVLCITLGRGYTLFGNINRFHYLTERLKNLTHPLNTSAVEQNWIQQPLDHFDQTEKRTWKMRYFQNLELWKPNGPVYIYIIGEAKADPVWLSAGLTHNLAAETNGAMFAPEHRYYGESIPLDTSITENLKFLSSRQALADFAALIQYIKSSPQFQMSKVVVIGGSYAGNLAAWMRLLYPHLVDASVSSSAPVLAKKDFYEYLETVAQDFKHHGTPRCYEKIAYMFNTFATLLSTPEGTDQLKSDYNICKETDMTITENKQNFFSMMLNDFEREAQYGDISSIQLLCDKLGNHPFVYLESIFNINEFISLRGKSGCWDCDFNNLAYRTKNDSTSLSWIYQTCTEFGYFQSSNFDDNNPFTQNIPADFYYKLCSAVYGNGFDESRVDEGVKTTNEMYQGLHPNVTHVVFVNGDMDPWYRLGVPMDLSADAPAIVIPNSSHCRDLYADLPDDPKELTEARRRVKSLIKSWIGVAEFSYGPNEVRDS